jgi:cyclohexanecarboxyl-CoA dehydrogenase
VSPVDFSFSDEQDEFREQLRRFARARLAPHYQSDDRSASFRPEVHEELASIGLVALRVPDEYGGQGADCVTTGIACEEVGAADFNTGYVLINTALVSDILTRSCSDRQREEFLPPIAAGEALPALCLTEPGHGSDAASLAMRAERDGSGWRLTGEKTSITLGMQADTALVFARTGGDGAHGVSAFYVRLDERFVSRSAFVDLGNRAIGRSSLHFDGLPAPEEALVGAPGDGFVGVMRGFDYSRALIGLVCLGAAQSSISEAIQYARERIAFGSPIGKFQGVSYPLVEHQTFIRAARLLAYEALWRKDQGLDHSAEASMVKWWAPKLSVDAAHQALLTHGHAGYSEELPLAQRLRDIIGLEIGDGTAGIAKLIVARSLLGREAAP